MIFREIKIPFTLDNKLNDIAHDYVFLISVCGFEIDLYYYLINNFKNILFLHTIHHDLMFTPNEDF